MSARLPSDNFQFFSTLFHYSPAPTYSQPAQTGVRLIRNLTVKQRRRSRSRLLTDIQTAESKLESLEDHGNMTTAASSESAGPLLPDL